MTTQQGVFRLVYVSRTCVRNDGDEQQREVERILAASRRNNAPLGITGALLFSADCFAQTLEGPADAVEALFERIQMDDRHCDSVILQACPAAREFGDWSMAYAGRHDTDRLRYGSLTGVPPKEGEGQVLALLRAVVLRAAPNLVEAVAD